MKNKKGFTLVETIVVIVIIAILIAIAVPSVIKYVDDARDAGYLAQGRSILTSSQAYVTKAKGQGLDTFALVKDTKVMAEMVDDAGNDGTLLLLEIDEKGVNVSHFVYKIKEQDKYVEYTLSNHKMKVLDEYKGNDISTNMNVIIEAIKSIVTGIKTVDSGAIDIAGSNAEKVVNALLEKGIDLKNLNAVSWRYNASNGMFYFSPNDISTLNIGDVVPTIRYNTKTGTYTVWTISIREGSTDADDNAAKYNAYGNEIKIYNPDNLQGASQQTYESALKLYNQYIKDKG